MRMQEKYREWLVLGGLLIAILIPRLIGLADFVTFDEPYWLVSGSNFYYALGQREFGNTIYDYHPAVTTMWLITAAMLIYFPGYRGQGQGYFAQYKEWKYEAFLRDFGRQALDVLRYSRFLQILLLVFLSLLFYFLMQKLLGRRFSLAALLLVSFDPFFLGHSRLLTHEAMLSLLLMTSLTSMAVYLYHERRLRYLVLSAVAAGLGQLTKSSGIVLLPVIFLMLAVKVREERRSTPLRRSLPGSAKTLGLWAAILIATYCAMWPGMWVQPAAMLNGVYGNALNYAFHGVRSSVAAGQQDGGFNPNLEDARLFVNMLLWRTTPVIWLGALVAFPFWFKVRLPRQARQYITYVMLSGVSMFLLFAIAKGRNSPHYILLTYVTLDVWACVGLLGLSDWLALKWGQAGPWLSRLAIAFFVVAQALSCVRFYPYYYTYFNPIMKAMQPGMQDGSLGYFGYGEGLDLAAKYLGQKGDATNLTVLAYWSDGPFSYFFPGRSIILANYYSEPALQGDLIAELRRSDYLVIYYAFQKAFGRLTNVLHALEPYPPQKVIWMNGIEYIRIYNIRDLPEQFFSVLANQ